MNRRTLLVQPPRVAIALAALALVTLAGCPREPDFRRSQRGNSLQRSGGADLAGVEAKLEQIDEWNRAASSESIAIELNEWIRDGRADGGWSRDPLIDELPQEFRRLDPVRGVGGTKFDPTDVTFLVERRLVHATSERIVAAGVCTGCDLFLSDGPLDSNEAPDATSRLETTSGEKATLLFDWTIRNIVLQPMPEAPPAPSADVPGSGLAVLSRRSGAGYVLPLDQVLLRGQGDAWMRLRVFLALCEQQGLPAVALGVPSGNRAEPQAPRLAGVLVDDELLVYDLALGLPIPGGEGHTASFEEFRADPSSWKSAIETAFAGETPGREFAFAEPERMVAYVPADPASLSRRMAALEQEWSGAARVRLTVRPSAIAARLKEVAGIERTEIWNLPIESLLHEATIAELARRNDPGILEHLRDRQIFAPPTPIYLARKTYLVGPPSREEDPLRAKEILLNATLTEGELDRIETSREMQESLGYDLILEQIPDPQQKQAFLRQAREQMGAIKKLARYYMGFAQYQDRDFQQATLWFERAAEQSGEGLWRTGSYYNLGRSLEAEGRRSAAVSLYRQDKTVQRPMSVLRAARLAERAGLATTAAPADPPEAGSDDATSDGADATNDATDEATGEASETAPEESPREAPAGAPAESDDLEG